MSGHLTVTEDDFMPPLPDEVARAIKEVARNRSERAEEKDLLIAELGVLMEMSRHNTGSVGEAKQAVVDRLRELEVSYAEIGRGLDETYHNVWFLFARSRSGVTPDDRRESMRSRASARGTNALEGMKVSEVERSLVAQGHKVRRAQIDKAIRDTPDAAWHRREETDNTRGYAIRVTSVDGLLEALGIASESRQ